MRKPELKQVWSKLDKACEAIESLWHDEEASKLWDKYNSRIDFSAIVNLKNDIEELIDKKSRI